MNDKRLPHPTGFLRRFWQNMACRVVFFCLVCLLPGTLWAATYYVDATGGSDANNGTPNEVDAWQTLAQVSGSTLFNAGDTIRFKRGEVWHESLTIPSSGAAENPITFGAYGTGDLPVFDGTTTKSWTPQGGSNIYTAAWSTGDPGMLIYSGAPKPPIATLTFSSDVSAVQVGAVLIQNKSGYAYSNFWVTSVDAATRQVSGITFFRDSSHWVANVPDSIQLRQVVNGQETKSRLTLSQGLHVYADSLQKFGDWYWDSNTLYLYSDSNPDSIVSVSELTTGIYALNQQYLTIQDIAVQGFQDTGVHLDNTNHSVVQRMEVSNIGAIQYKSGIILDHSSDNNILNNQVKSVLRAGISLYAGESDTDFSRNNIVSGNTIEEAGSSGVSLGVAPAATADNVKDNTITGNTILNSNTLAWDSAGVYALFVGTHTIQNNRIMYGGSRYLRSSGIMLDQGVAATSITDNVIENNSFAGIAVTGKGHTITGNRLTNNGLSSSASAQIVFFPVAENVSATTVTGNILVADTGKRLFLEAIDSNLNTVSNTVNNNTYRSRAASTFCWINWRTSWEYVWIDFKSWQATTGYDTNSYFFFITDPPPTDPPTGKSINSTYLLLLK